MRSYVCMCTGMVCLLFIIPADLPGLQCSDLRKWPLLIQKPTQNCPRTQVTGGLGRVTGGLGRVTGGLGRVTGGLGRVTGGLGRVTGGLGRVTGGLGRVTGGSQGGWRLGLATQVRFKG